VNKRLGTLLVISVALHLFFLLLITAPEFHRFLERLQPTPTVPPPPPSLTMLKLEEPPKPPPPPPETQFVPTLPSQEVPVANPNAILESERNTALKSREAAKDPNSPLPAVTGNPKAAFNYQDTPFSPQVKSTAAQPAPQSPPTPQTPPAPQTPPQKPTPPTPPTPPVPKAQPVTPITAKPEPNLPPPSFDTTPVTPPPVDTKNQGDKDKDVKAESKAQDPQQAQPQQQAQPPPQPQAKPPQPQPPSPPPTPMSFAQQRSDMGGSAPEFGDPSPESKETEIGKYKAKLYRMIGSKWYLNVEKSMSMLSVGEVHIKFYVQANGVIDPKSIEVESGGNSDILETISRDAVKGAYGEPFSDSMKQQLGAGYSEDITFTIY